MAIPILSTKLHIPAPRADLVRRSRLIERLNAGLRRKLTLVSAPAGFGKTTLLAAWVDQCPHPVAWISLDERDGEPLQFLAYLVSALQTIEPSLGELVLGALSTSQPPAIDALLTTLLNDIATVPDDFLLILDDYHTLVSAPVDDALMFVLDHLPSQMHLVIATREDPQLPLARLRVRDQLTELRAADLRFLADETAHFLNQVMGLRLSTEDVAALENRTEGWIAGLQLAALSIQGRADDTAAFIRAFTGSHRFVLDYLLDEVLRRQSEVVRHFLLQTSILERLNGALCDAVTGGTASQKTLETLERGNLFVVPLDDTRGWYRYHHLFAGALRNHLLSAHPDKVPALHQRACDWYVQHDLPQDAIRHALAAEDFERAAGLLESIWTVMDENYQSATWLDWAQALPEAVILSRPLLCLGYGRSLSYAGELEAAERWFQAAESWLNRPADEQQTITAAAARQMRLLPAYVRISRAYSALALGDARATLRHARQTLDVVIEEDHLSYIQAVALSGIARWVLGDLAAAEQTLSDFIAHMRSSGRIQDGIELVFVIADMQITRGKLSTAYQTYDEAFKLLADLGNPLLMGIEDLHRGISELYREWGKLDTAEDHLVAAEELTEHLVIRPDWRHRLGITWARLKMTQGDLSAALTWLDEAQAHYFRTPLPDVRPTAAIRARIWIKQGKLAMARDWARQGQITPDDEITYLHEYEFITLARLLLAEYRVSQSIDGFQRAQHLLARLWDAAHAGGRLGSTLEILMLRALLHDAQGDITAALAALEHALVLAEPEGYLSLFIDEGEPMRQLLRRAVQQDRLPEYTTRLLAAFESPAGQPIPTQPLTEPLSEREQDVLRLLHTDLTGPEIARELIVSLSTMRTHTRSIYGKLGVNSRRAAVRRAQELGLL